jgi:CBS domain containing-hemolysin-like protein
MEELAVSKNKEERLSKYLAQLPSMNLACLALKTLFQVLLILAISLIFLKGPGGKLSLIFRSQISALMVSVVFILVFGEALPALMVGERSERMAWAFFPLFYGLAILFVPLATLLGRMRQIYWRLRGYAVDKSPSTTLAEEIDELVSEGQREGIVEEEAREMIESVLKFRDVDVAEVMTPRTEMVMVEVSASLVEAQKLAMEEGYSRLPVFKENRDNIVGVLYVKDLLQPPGADEAHITVADIMRKPYFVPETKPLGQLLREMRNEKVHIALVLDEYGGTAGLITIEDILEEIVGEIQDEYDTAALPFLRQIDQHTAELDARVHIDEFNEALGTRIPESDDYETVGGFLFTSVGRIPKSGETLRHENIVFKILSANERSIKRLRVEVEPEE